MRCSVSSIRIIIRCVWGGSQTLIGNDEHLGREKRTKDDEICQAISTLSCGLEHPLWKRTDGVRVQCRQCQTKLENKAARRINFLSLQLVSCFQDSEGQAPGQLLHYF